MNKKYKIIIVTSMVALTLALTFSGTVLAQNGNTPENVYQGKNCQEYCQEYCNNECNGEYTGECDNCPNNGICTRERDNCPNSGTCIGNGGSNNCAGYNGSTKCWRIYCKQS